MNESSTEIYEETILNSLLKATDVAEILNISNSMAYRLMKANELPTVKIGKIKRVRPIDLHNYINANLTMSKSNCTEIGI